MHSQPSLGTQHHRWTCRRLVSGLTAIHAGVADCQLVDGQHAAEPRQEHVLACERRTRQVCRLSILTLPVPPLTNVRRPPSQSTTDCAHYG